ncbi:MAG: peptidoglycan-binding domain-containing protein [Micropruina sp.]|uniref:hypothetical protein n=1 Tax=Micropruina sp. TaxID=2737536 RepID=UPI0039E4D2C7
MAESSEQVGGDVTAGKDHQARRRHRRRLLKAGAPVWSLAVVAGLFLLVGFALGGVIESPEDAASRARPPAPGLITVPVEAREITSTVTARAEVAFADPVVVDPSLPLGADAAVVTGRVPKVGVKVGAGTVLLEVSGRPIFVLPGKFPAYRTMGPGSVGPDVAQLRKALAKLGYPAGNGGKTYDAALAKAVRHLYVQAGYPAPGSENVELAEAMRTATEARDSARQARQRASAQVATARKLPKLKRKAAVEEAEQALKSAKRDESRAAASLAAARKAAWTPMPIGEVVFVSGLPRRVDAVNVKLGQDLAGSSASSGPEARDPGASTGAVVLSGAEIRITATVSGAEAALLKQGGPVQLTASDGTSVEGHVARLCDQASRPLGNQTTGTPDCAIAIGLNDPERVSPDALIGNMLATFQVGRSSPDALVVPVAAVSADSAGRARVEVVDGELVKDAPAADQPTRVVVFEPGLSAEGYVELRSSTPTLKAGDLVVVGRAVTAETTPTPEPTR